MAPVLYGPSLPGCGVSEGSRTSLRKVSSPGQGRDGRLSLREKEMRILGNQEAEFQTVFFLNG